MDSLGACFIANDLPFTGMAKDLFDRRVKGESWKKIADDFALGSPAQARKKFQVLTGIDDFKIKGQDLLKFVKGGVNTTPKIPRISGSLLNKPVFPSYDSAAKFVPQASDYLVSKADADYFVAKAGKNPPNSLISYLRQKKLTEDEITSFLEAFSSGGKALIPDKVLGSIGKKLDIPIPPTLVKGLPSKPGTTKPKHGEVFFDIDAKTDVLTDLLGQMENNSVISQIINNPDIDAYDVKNYFLENKGLSNKQYAYLYENVDIDVTPEDVRDIYKKLGIPPSAYLDKFIIPKSTLGSIPIPKIDNTFIGKEYETVSKLWHSKDFSVGKAIAETNLNKLGVDTVVWREALIATKGDVYKAYRIAEPYSNIIAAKALDTKLFELRKMGKTVKEISTITDMSETLIHMRLKGPSYLNLVNKQNLTSEAPKFESQPLTKPPKYVPPVIGAPIEGNYTSVGGRYGTKEFPMPLQSEIISDYDVGQISAGSKRAIGDYTGGSSAINDRLREGRYAGQDGAALNYTDKQISEIDKGMLPAKRNFTVTRGVNLNALGPFGPLGSGALETKVNRDFVKDRLTGTLLIDKAYGSSSIARDGKFHREARLEIKVPVGARGFYVEQISSFPTELEYLMARDTGIMIEEVLDLELPDNVHLKSHPGERILVRGRVIA